MRVLPPQHWRDSMQGNHPPRLRHRSAFQQLINTTKPPAALKRKGNASDSRTCHLRVWHGKG